MFDVRGKRVMVLGAARSGIGAANLLVALGAIVKISDSKPLAEIDKALQGLHERSKVIVQAGGHTQDFVEDNDLIIVSPGIPAQAKPLQWAAAKGIEVFGEVELAYRLCPCPIIAVTGSNGKTTTVTLIARILEAAGKKVCLCGNIGQAFSSFVLDLTAQHIVVLEISSFQLQTTIQFRPNVAVWTNFSQNHLDRHADLDEYFQAKVCLVSRQTKDDIAILNAQQPEHRLLAKTLKSCVDFFNETNENSKITNPNYLAAWHAVKAVGVDDAIAHEVFRNFKGVEHRLEFVRTIEGVDYINDSKSTTVEAGRWALMQVEKPMVLIVGGLDKHLDYSPLKPLVSQKVKHMVAIGQARDIMKQTFGDVVDVTTFTDFAKALGQAKHVAQPGDAVVLSPMCASFDMFDDYEHRGRVFKEMVHQL